MGIAVAEVLAERQPSPFDERETGEVEAALDDATSALDSRLSELQCVTIDTRHKFTGRLFDLLDDVRQARPVAEEAAEQFIRAWHDAEFQPRNTFRDIAELIQQKSASGPPEGTGRCRALLELARELTRDARRVSRARNLLHTQQQGTEAAVKNALDSRITGIIDELEERNCFRFDPDFEAEDLRRVYRDLAFAIIRPSADLGEAQSDFRQLIGNMLMAPPERIGTQRAIPGEDVEERRTGGITGTRGAETAVPTLDEELILEPDPDAEADFQHSPFISVVDGELQIDTGIIKGVPAPGVADRVEDIVRDTVRVDLIEKEGRVDIGTYKVGVRGQRDTLPEIRLNAGTPITEDAADEHLGGAPEMSEEFEEAARFAELRQEDVRDRLHDELQEDARELQDLDREPDRAELAQEMTDKVDRLVDAGVIGERNAQTFRRQIADLQGVPSIPNMNVLIASLDRILE